MGSDNTQPGVHWGRVALIILFLAGAWAVWHFIYRTAQPDFDVVGGTILLFEPAPDKKMEESGDLDHTLEQLRLRLAAVRLPITVRRSGDRIEVRIARTAQHARDVERVRGLAAAAGKLEFRILANEIDDAAAYEGVREALAQARDLDERARKGLPPPEPLARDPKQRDAGVFHVTLARGQVSVVTYSWIELGPQQREALDIEAAIGAARLKLNEAAKLKDSASSRFVLQGALFFARECVDESIPEKERAAKKFDVFVLARDPEYDDPATLRQTPELDGSYLVDARALTEKHDIAPAGSRGHHVVDFRFGPEGAKILAELTRKNEPTGLAEEDQTRRHLAIVLDERVLTAPSINSAIHDGHGQISGAFTREEVEDLTAILRGGRLPVRLKLLTETAVGPGGK